MEDHLVWIDADNFTPVRDDLIPTGEIRPVEGTPLDFRTEKVLGKDICDPYEQITIGGGYDHNFVLNHYDGTLRKVASVKDPESGRVSGGLHRSSGDAGLFRKLPGRRPRRKKWCRLCRTEADLAMETQYCPDAIHHENFVSPILKAGEVYDTVTVYKFHAE
ncbi:MAG: hypothetical protein ACLR6B_01870 [Blautia sp.]